MNRFWLFWLLVLCQLASLLGPIRGLWALVTGNNDRALEIAKGYDLLGNTILNGKAGEYISTRAHYARIKKKRWGCILCKILDAIVDNHCEDSAKNQIYKL